MKLGLSLSLGSNTLRNGPYVAPVSLYNGDYRFLTFSFSSISNYTKYVDINSPYSLQLPDWMLGVSAEIPPSFISYVNVENTPRGSVTINRLSENIFEVDITDQTGPFYDYKGNAYYDSVYVITYTLKWNGASWQLIASNHGASPVILRTYSGGTSSLLPLLNGTNTTGVGALYYDNRQASRSLVSASNLLNDNNILNYRSKYTLTRFANRTAESILTQTGKLGVRFKWTLFGFSSGSPSVAVSYTASDYLYSILKSYIGSVYLPKEGLASFPLQITTNGDLYNLTSNYLQLNQSSVEMDSTGFDNYSTTIQSNLLENTSASARELTISGSKKFDNTSFNATTSLFQCGTAQPSPYISISSNTTTPRNFYLTHTGNTLATRTTGENEGLALWDSTKKLWAIPKMGQYIRYYGGKYEFINISGTTIQTSSSVPWLASTNACSPSVMPWDAVWNGNINVSKHYFDAMQKPTTLQINGTIRFPYSGNSAINYPIKSSQNQIGQQGFIYNDFVCGQYRKLVFKGRQGGIYYGSSGVDMTYSYSENKWFLNIYEYISDGKGGSYGDNFSYSASYSTSFPITFTYIGSGNGTTNLNSSTLVVSKVTSTNFDDVYTLADASYPVTIPVDTAFSSIW